MPQIYTEPSKQIPVYGQYETVVVGGGCAGFTAAIAAARNGAKTLIIEQFSFFGGTATASLMANINAFRNQVKPDNIQTTKGIGEELILRLNKIGGVNDYQTNYQQDTHYDTTKGNLAYCYGIDTEKLKYMTLKMVVESGAEILFHTYFCDVIKEGNKVTGIIIENKSGRQAIYAKVVVDATGDGDVACRAGAPFWQVYSDEAKRLGDALMVKIGNVEKNSTAHGCGYIGNTMVYWGPQATSRNGANAKELTESEIETRLSVYDDLAAKAKKNPAFKNAKILDTGCLLGIRQTRFIEGEYKITADDVVSGKMFPDTIAMCSSPIINYYGYRRYLEHTGYGIPYRCLLPKNINSVIVAGRCISSDQPAYESWRAMAPIMAIGEAAGTAAALASATNKEPRNLDINTLRDSLIKQGAELGQSFHGTSKKGAEYVLE